MRSPLFSFLILLACASEGAAHGSIAYGYDATNTIRFFTSQNQLTERDAESAAIQQCRAQGLSICQTLNNFENTCAAVALTLTQAQIGFGQNATIAASNAVARCLSDRHSACNASVSICDATPILEPPPEPVEETAPFNFGLFSPAFFREVQIEIASTYAAITISIALVLWVFVSIVLATPPVILKRRAAVSAWIVLPAVLAYPFYQLSLGFLLPAPALSHAAFNAFVFLLLWPNVFVALVIGGNVRRELLDSKRVPDPLSLPLATFAFTAVTAGALTLFISFGTLPRPPDCGTPPYPTLNACSYFEYEGWCVGTAWLIFLIIGGLALPADSNLILGYERLRAFLRRSHRTNSQHLENAVVTSGGGYPPPAVVSQDSNQLWQDISVAPPSGPMMLKIKKSQGRNVWGTVVFMIDARMELSAEERHLVEKYRLGDMMIYSSTARDRHKEAIKAHLEGTKGHPVYTLSVKDQFIGVLKTFFSLGMAGAHAAMAAYHLKITVYKLMRGVHVRCKDMNEVLVAKKAIVEAGENLRAYLDVAQTFDGTEEILEF